jgi:hypothetical protein
MDTRVLVELVFRCSLISTSSSRSRCESKHTRVPRVEAGDIFEESVRSGVGRSGGRSDGVRLLRRSLSLRTTDIRFEMIFDVIEFDEFWGSFFSFL